MTNPLAGKIGVRDALQFFTVVAVGLGSYFGLRSDVAVVRQEIADVKRSVERMDDRLWQLQGERTSPALLDVSAIPCPADATRVVLR